MSEKGQSGLEHLPSLSRPLPPGRHPYLGSWEIECVVSGAKDLPWHRPPGRLRSVCQRLLTSDLKQVKPSLRVSPRLSPLGLRPAGCKCVSAIRKMGGLVSWSAAARSTGRGPPGPALSSFRTYCGHCRGPEKRDRRPLPLSGRFDVLSPRSVGWLLGNWARRRRHSLNETFLLCKCKCCCCFCHS